MYYYFSTYENEIPDLDFQELYAEFSSDELNEIKIICGKGLHEVLQLAFRQEKDPFIFSETF